MGPRGGFSKLSSTGHKVAWLLGTFPQEERLACRTVGNYFPCTWP